MPPTVTLNGCDPSILSNEVCKDLFTDIYLECYKIEKYYDKYDRYNAASVETLNDNIGNMVADLDKKITQVTEHKDYKYDTDDAISFLKNYKSLVTMTLKAYIDLDKALDRYIKANKLELDTSLDYPIFANSNNFYKRVCAVLKTCVTVSVETYKKNIRLLEQARALARSIIAEANKGGK